MSSEVPEQPKLHPPPDNVEQPEGDYTPAAQDIENSEHLKLVENFIGSVYGEAKQIDNSNVGSSQYTKGLKFDAKEAIVDARRSLIQKNPDQQSKHLEPLAPRSTSTVSPNQTIPPVQQMQQNYNVPPAVAPMDSLILKSEIDTLKEQVRDIKKLYDEFFKLKQVKGYWQIKANDKIQKTTSIAKTWNAINKLLKSKTDSIIIEYKESDE